MFFADFKEYLERKCNKCDKFYPYKVEDPRM